MSEPKTAAGRKFASRIYGITGIFVEGDILAIEAEAASAAIWDCLEAQPGFNEAVAKGEADIAAGKGIPFKDIRREAAAQAEGSLDVPRLVATLADPEVDHRIHAYSFTRQQQAEAIAAAYGSWNLGHWYAAFEKVSGLEAKTPEGRRDIFNRFVAEYARLVAEEHSDAR